MSEKVLLGMSGGVDSAVSAIVLKEIGYDVTGITFKFVDNEAINKKNIEDADDVCKELEIKHISMDEIENFKKNVIDDFINEYKNCRTPNPCIVCNKFMKFENMYEIARRMEMNFIATGHYAKKVFSEKYKRYVIKKSNNIKKDQSYFLYKVPKDVISHIIFPLEEYESKEQIRDIAKERNLFVAEKKDSEDICFIKDGDYKKFLEENSDIKPKSGNIVDYNGKILGKHEGIYKYTIGQRKGLGISNSVPLFVIGLNKEKNEVIVGEEDKLYKKEVVIKDINLQAVDKIDRPMRVKVKTRYTTKDAMGVILSLEVSSNDKLKILFDDSQRALTPGQSAVFYDEDDVLIGGGVIEG